jgi:ATP-binding cassette subfamily C protein
MTAAEVTVELGSAACGAQKRGAGWAMLGRELFRRRRALVPVLGWSTLEALPGLLSGWLVAMAADRGFLAGRPWEGAAWLGAFGAGQLVRTLATRGLLPRLADIVEPIRDVLVARVVAGALRQAVHGGERADNSALARLTEQVQSVRGLISALLTETRRIAISIVTAVVGLAALSPPLAGLAIAPVLVSLVLFGWLQRRVRVRQHAVLVADEVIARDAVDVLEGIRDVVACGAEGRVAHSVGVAVDAQALAARRLATGAAARLVVMAAAEGSPLLVVLAATPWLLGTGKLAVGTVLGAITYITVGLQPAISNLLGALSGFGMQLGVTLDRIAHTSAAPVSPHRPGPVPLTATLHIENLTFAYGPHAEPVIREMNLSIAEGEHLAVVGPSGIGKSTFADLLTGLSRPQHGAVRLGRIPVQDVYENHLRGAIALIPQESYLFAGTLADNLRYLAPRARAADLRGAVHALGLDGLVTRMGGLDAELDLAGPALGLADRQLVALARVYLSPAAVVILDEGTCHLDPMAEEVVERAFRQRPGTLIVIAHRMSSARRADRVLVMDGRTCIAGTHEYLMAHSGMYRELTGHWEDAAGQPSRSPDRPAAHEVDNAPGTRGRAEPVRQVSDRPLADPRIAAPRT